MAFATSLATSFVVFVGIFYTSIDFSSINPLSPRNPPAKGSSFGVSAEQ
jgi:hypothetical protein